MTDFFDIAQHVEFNAKNRAICPSCADSKGASHTKLNLSLLPNGAYHCFAGCTSDDIRSALGTEKLKQIPQSLASDSPAAKKVTISPQKVAEAHNTLMSSDGVAKQWLTNRGITPEMTEHFRLGIARSKVGKKHYPSIAIPIPANDPATQYFQKKRVAPWLPVDELPAEYKPWSQYGIPATVWFTHKPDQAIATYLCEGEWDAIMLGWMAKQLNASICVATFTCGADNVPSEGELERLPGTVTIFYDRNDKPIKNGERTGDKGAKKAAKALGDRAQIAAVPMPENCDVVGWDVSNAINHGFKWEDFEKAASVATFTQSRDKETIDIAAITQTRKGRLLEVLRNAYSERLRYSTLSKQVEMDSQLIDPDFVYLSLLEEGLDVGSKEFAIDVFLYLAKKHQYNPVQEYLEQCHQTHKGDGIDLLNNAASRYLGNDEPLHNAFLRKTLIAAVARALSPGCKVDTALIFVGRQGVGKSSFWAILAGEWFCDSLSGQTSDTDEKLKLYSAWIHEWAELEQVFKRKETSQVKSFLSATTDTFRQPWGRSAEKHPRHSVIVGTTNEDDFLADSTGSRRYWVVPIKNKVCLELLERERDVLWSAAVHAYKEGASWTLSQAEAAQSEKQNQHYQREDPWFSTIEAFLKHEDSIKVCDLLAKAIGLELSRQDRSAQMRVADCLKTLGWKKQHTKIGKIWVKGSQVVTDPVEDNDSSVYNGDYLLSLGSHEVVGSHHKEESEQNDHFQPDDYLTEVGSHPKVVTAETLDDKGVQPSGDYLTTKNAPNLPRVVNLPESDHLEPGDTVQILTGRWVGTFATVEAANGKVITVRAKNWYVSQKRDRADLKLIKRGESDANG